jgi:hypothetical protein
LFLALALAPLGQAEQRKARAAMIGLEKVVAVVFGDEDVMRQAQTLGEKDTLKLDTDKDGDPDVLVWREGRNVVAGLDGDDDATPNDARPDTDSDCWTVDYGGDGECDRVVDYDDEDNDGDGDTMTLYLLTPNVWSSRDMTCVVIRDLDDDNQTWHLVNYEYHQGACQWKCDFSGDQFFCMGYYNEPQRRWISRFENPFCFYDVDDDGDSEIAVRFEGTDCAVRSLRYSFDVDNDATPESKYDYDFSLTALGNVQVPNEFAMTLPLRGGGGLTCVDWKRARKVAEESAWSRALLCWDENDNNVNPAVGERIHERWEGVIAHRSAHFPQVGGPSCGTFNKRYEVDNDGSGNLRLYYSNIDHRFHLRGAEFGWLDADYNNDGRTDVRWRYEDANGNGFFDTYRVDADADGKWDWSATFSDERARLGSWDYKEMRSIFKEGLAAAQASLERRLQTLKARAEGRESEIERYWKEGLPGFYAAEKVRNSAEGKRFYLDLMVAQFAIDAGEPVLMAEK